jgi:GPH family glycoside/pentoside/hexuronide:cation symporter
MGTAAAVPAARILSPLSRWSFGLGSIAYGIKDNGFATFLLLFYNQVVGLPAGTVGLAIMAAMVVEAFVDPLVGFLSDHTRSRWGRRHPWMYGSALPVAIGWVLLWNPPHWGHMGLLVYLFGTALLVRSALSAFEIPSSALGPELSADYDERTRLFSYRYLFGWIGGIGMLSLAYAVFLVPDATHANGLQNGAGYARMAWFAAGVMLLSIGLSSIGLHPEIEHLPKIARSDETLADHLRSFRQTIANKGFAILMLAGLFAYTGQGISFALSNYMYQYVWEFHGADYQWLSLSLLAGAFGAFLIVPRLTIGTDKPRVATILALVNVVLVVIPYVLKLTNLFPLHTSPLHLPILLAIWMVNTMCGVGVFILGAAMLSDVVEESEQRTGKRSEGVFFAGGFFVQKAVGGLGIFMAGAVLAFADFPAVATSGQVPAATITRLVVVFIALMVVFYGLAALTYSRFPFGRAAHLVRLEQLGVRPE